MEEKEFREDTDVDLERCFPTGYVIELSNGQYFQRWKKRYIHCGFLTGATYFSTLKAAEDYIHDVLCFVGLDPYIRRVGWVLRNLEYTLYWGKDDYTPNRFDAQWFQSYEEALDFQKRHFLQENSVIDYDSYRVKKIVLAA